MTTIERCKAAIAISGGDISGAAAYLADETGDVALPPERT